MLARLYVMSLKNKLMTKFWSLRLDVLSGSGDNDLSDIWGCNDCNKGSGEVGVARDSMPGFPGPQGTGNPGHFSTRGLRPPNPAALGLKMSGWWIQLRTISVLQMALQVTTCMDKPFSSNGHHSCIKLLNFQKLFMFLAVTPINVTGSQHSAKVRVWKSYKYYTWFIQGILIHLGI